VFVTIEDALCEISELSTESLTDDLGNAAMSETLSDARANLLDAAKAARKFAAECEALAKRMGAR
jgi:hypothetical protein